MAPCEGRLAKCRAQDEAVAQPAASRCQKGQDMRETKRGTQDGLSYGEGYWPEVDTARAVPLADPRRRIADPESQAPSRDARGAADEAAGGDEQHEVIAGTSGSKDSLTAGPRDASDAGETREVAREGAAGEAAEGAERALQLTRQLETQMPYER